MYADVAYNVRGRRRPYNHMRLHRDVYSEASADVGECDVKCGRLRRLVVVVFVVHAPSD